MSRKWLLIDLGILAAGIALVLGWHPFFHWFLHVTGADNVSGPWYGFWSGFGSDIGEFAIAGSVIDAARRAVHHHAELLTQNAQHHRERLAQDREHHEAHLALVRRHHQQQLDQADAHHDALKAHIGATPKPADDKPAADPVAPCACVGMRGRHQSGCVNWKPARSKASSS